MGKRSKPQNIRNEEYPSGVRRTASARCVRVAADSSFHVSYCGNSEGKKNKYALIKYNLQLKL